LEDSRIQRLNSELRPGVARGEGILDVRVEERSPYRISFEYNNYQSPSIGENRGIVTLEHQNVTGNGDVFTGQYGRSRGLDPMLDFKYSFPVTARNTILSFQYRRNTFSVVDQPFEELDLDSKSDMYTLSVRHALYRARDNQIVVEFTGERLSHKTTLLGERFSLEPGAQNGRTAVTALPPRLERAHKAPNPSPRTRSL